MAGDRSGRYTPVSSLSRRHFLGAFLTLAAWLQLARPAHGRAKDDGQTVIKGGWLLKRSDLP
ncbi:MAG: hypothetical protein WCC66_05495 [Rhizobiaceae bacterium]